MLLTIIIFLVVLSILVFFHESGHYLAARHVGVRVLQFSIGFPPRIFGRKIGETEYVFSLIPVGGYVRLEGQNIEDENPSDPRNYASKSILQRFYILVAGPLANLLLAVLIIPLVFMLGVETAAYRLGPADIVGSAPGSISEAAGFLPGDRIVGVGDADTASWNDVYREISLQAVLGDAVSVRTDRGGRITVLELPSVPVTEGKPVGWKHLIAPVAGEVTPGFPALEAGMQPGDRIVAINGTPISRWDQIPGEIQKGKGEETSISLQRGEQRLELHITPSRNEDAGSWIIGISPGRVKQRHGPVDSVRLGVSRLWEITSTTFVVLGRLFSGNASIDAVGGPVKIGKFVGQAARSGLADLLFLMAIISLNLGIFNLLPFPPLDGGHILLLAVEWVKGSPLNAKLRERTQMVGFSLLILMMIIITFNDIVQNGS